MIKLSICIPTYNRAYFLSELLDSIYHELNNDIKNSIEICINDNASTDDTIDTIKHWEDRFQNFVYRVNRHNEGADINYQKVVEIASGEYVWFMGSDDKIIPGSIFKILEIIKKDSIGILIANRIECSKNMNPIANRFWLSTEIDTMKFSFGDINKLNIYLEKSESLGAIFSFLSSIIFKRKLWDTSNYSDLNLFNGSAYSHVYMLFKIYFDSRNSDYEFKYINDSIVFSRGNNDAFLSTPKKRLQLDFNGYRLVTTKLEIDDSTRKKILNVLSKEHPYNKLIKSLTFYRLNKTELNQLVHDVYTQKEINNLKRRNSIKFLYFLFYGIKRAILIIFHKIFT